MRPQYREAVEVRHAVVSGTDARGNAVIEYGEPHTERVLVAPAGSEDLNDRRDGYTLRFELYADPGADFLADDQVTVRGEALLVVGEPARWKPAYGPHEGIVVRCYTVKG